MADLRATATKTQKQLLPNVGGGSVEFDTTGDYHDYDVNDLLTLDDGDAVMAGLLIARGEGDITLKVGAITLVVSGAGAGEVNIADIAALKTYLETEQFVVGASFVSTEQTGDGTEQDVAHGLGRVPDKVLVVTTEPVAPFVSAEQTGDGTEQDVAHGLGATPDNVTVAMTEIAGPSIFKSTEQTATTSEQTIPHGLGVIPDLVDLQISENDGSALDLIESTPADDTNVYVTGSSVALKYFVTAIKFQSADLAEGAHDDTNLKVTAPIGVKYIAAASLNDDVAEGTHDSANVKVTAAVGQKYKVYAQ